MIAMKYPAVTDRKVVEFYQAPCAQKAQGIQATVWLSAKRAVNITIDTLLLSLTDENEHDIFISEARRMDRSVRAAA